MSEELVIGLVSISDRASAGVYKDEGIPSLKEWLASVIASPKWPDETRLIADEQPVIEKTLKELVDERGCHLVLTTGGTGPARRDVTPEATLAVADKVRPGFGAGPAGGARGGRGKGEARLGGGDARHQFEVRAGGDPLAPGSGSEERR